MIKAAQSRSQSIYYRVSDLEMVRGEGIRIFDAQGRPYIDCASATFNLSLGYGHPAVLDAIARQSSQLIHVTSSFLTGPICDLADRLVALSPARLTKVHLKVSSGSVANEGAIKMAQRATGRRDVLSLFRSHHGQTFAMTSIAGNSFRRERLLGGELGSVQVPDPYCLRCFYKQNIASCDLLCVTRIADFIEFASSGSVAAIIAEPVLGNGGNIVPPREYFRRLRSLCDEQGIKLILDEIQTGIGRTGYMFAAEYFRVEPDVMTVGKGLGGSGVPIAAILASDEMTGLGIEEHSFTAGGNVVAAAVGLATLEAIESPGFLENVRIVGARLLDRLTAAGRRYPFVSDVRGLGLMIGLEIGDPSDPRDVMRTNRLAELALEHGLILRTSRYGRGNVLKVRPPLTLTPAEADEIADRTEALLDRAAQEFAAGQM